MTLPFFSVLLFLFYLALVLQTTWVAEAFPSFMKPDLALVFVVYAGTLPYLLSGAVLVAGCGLLFELFSGSPGGLILLVYFLFFFLLQGLAKFVLIGESLSFRMILIFGFSLLQDLLVGVLPFTLGTAGEIGLPPADWVFARAAATSLAGWPLWILFRKVIAWPRMTPPLKSD